MSNKKKEEVVNVVSEEVAPTKNYLKNYIILILIFVLCIGFAFYLRKQYEVYEAYKREIPIIGDTLSDITIDELEHYVVDNSSVVLYMCTASDEECRNFEKSFKRFVEKKELTDDIIYLNLSDDVNSDFVEYFNDRFSNKTKLKGSYPAFVVFKDGDVEAILQSSSKKKLTVSKVQTFLELYMEDDEYEDEELETNIDNLENNKVTDETE